MIAPNMPTPTANAARLAAVKTRVQNSSTGTIGCSTRRSHQTKTASTSAEIAYSSGGPPWTIASRPADRPNASRPAPA